MSIANRILKKLKHLHNYKIYSEGVFKDCGSPSNIYANINRLVAKGEIKKAGKGYFYKSENKKPQKRAVYQKPLDINSVRYQKIKPSKHPIFKHLFWSNQNNPIPLSNYIAKVLSEDAICNVRDAILLFGEKEILDVYFSKFKKYNIKLDSVEGLLHV